MNKIPIWKLAISESSIATNKPQLSRTFDLAFDGQSLAPDAGGKRTIPFGGLVTILPNHTVYWLQQFARALESIQKSVWPKNLSPSRTSDRCPTRATDWHLFFTIRKS
jgi:hypothetical protein